MTLENILNTRNYLSGYNVHRQEDREKMFQAIGINKIEDLFEQIPDILRLKKPLSLPKAMSEWKLENHLRDLAAKNLTLKTHLSFLGGGVYDHFIPATVDAISNRGELLTSYTPYQPQMSQGLLQILFEYQKMISILLGLPAVNCSVYDGATALAEGAWMACVIKETKCIIAADGIWPEYQNVLNNYMKGRNVEIIYVNQDKETGLVDQTHLIEVNKNNKFATILVQSPNKYGVLENLASLSEFAISNNALFNLSTYPMALGLLEAPGKQSVDIVTCEGQSLGIHLNAGGPYLGIMGTHKKYEEFLPGRLVGCNTDTDGNHFFSLIKEYREQHVSRENATSHICSNQALQAVKAVVYLATLGENGFKELSLLNAQKAHYFQEKLCAIAGVSLARKAPFFNEFCIKLPCLTDLFLNKLEEKNIFAGIKIGPYELLIAVTEKHTREQLEYAAKVFSETIKTIHSTQKDIL